MTQYERNGVVFTIPDAGKMLRVVGTEDVISKAADIVGKVPEYEEVDDDSQNE